MEIDDEPCYAIMDSADLIELLDKCPINKARNTIQVPEHLYHAVKMMFLHHSAWSVLGGIKHRQNSGYELLEWKGRYLQYGHSD